ncbi:MAG: hypothetical protein FWF08_10175 [Oscillospiraceae bacterium]|nr:hypothetical protein [Oscillospiraceae bacterium]
MMFDINQKEFPSFCHQKIWEKAVLITPFSCCAGDNYLNYNNIELMESCKHFHDYFIALYEDIYTNMLEYDIGIDPRMMYFADFYREIGLLGKVDGDCFVLNEKGTKRVKKMKDCEVLAWERQGLRVGNGLDRSELTNGKFPKMFMAVKAMAEASKKQSTQGKFNFYECEFRQLFKNFTPGFNDIVMKMNDISKEVTETLDLFAKERKLRRSTGWNLIYMHKKHHVFRIGTSNGSRAGIDIYTAHCGLELVAVYFDILNNSADDIKEFCIKHTKINQGCSRICESKRPNVTILGNELKAGCSLYIDIGDEIKDKIDYIKKLIDIRIKAIDKLTTGETL